MGSCSIPISELLLTFKLRAVNLPSFLNSTSLTYGNIPICLCNDYQVSTRVFDDQRKYKSCMSHSCK